MPLIITAFEDSPDRGQGLARDMPVRWALEEVGEPYEVRLVSFASLKAPAHRALQPFGQIPTYENGDLVLFESGAIVLHIAEHHAGLLPEDTGTRARAVMWMFAAISTIVPPIVQREFSEYIERDKSWYKARLPMLESLIRKRLEDLSRRLDDSEWLEQAFSAGDLLMIQVLRRLKGTGMLEEFPVLSAYVSRGEARPAFKRAFDAQLEVFNRKQRRQREGDS
ncbi:glutathione S-transferase family protein [Methylophaga lonarensis]|uniref:glutathione S-transferase family protein n=1 Tax=Methylophaga lonarensis TaxID=999151 RepID=UPI003D2BE90A